ncbi:MAG: indolepyruvate ferredoxin oxidoreductase subunit alpha [Clostridiales bacterium]|jgi:indolepyruvate ferredoxin oxidoreductase alpha subunit|nr:indolepyruvate ferredoxin oxidoreductase subunit alpha [Clostridiales bacterium]
MSGKILMLGNAAVARGAYEAGAAFVSSYPGTPSTEITECAADYPELYAEWAPNEKVAAETAIGASVAGARAMTCMKHVGLNVAADPVFTASYTGVNGGLALVVADDPGMHSSQNEQDSRNYARSAKLPMLEPADSAECKSFTKLAFELSERFDTPVLLRLSTRVSHSQSLVELGERESVERKAYKKDPMKYVMMPGMAKLRHLVVEKRVTDTMAYAEGADINRIEYHDKSVGIIAAGIAHAYAREALGERASYLKLGMVWPLPELLIREFAANVGELWIIEELDPFIEREVRAMGIAARGKTDFSPCGEYTSEEIRAVVLGEPAVCADPPENIPGRPPVMCAGCPHRGVFNVLSRMRLTVLGDIGCYTLGALPPLNALDTCLCMGGSVSMAHGMEKAAGRDFSKKAVAVIGDSTFLHSGITGLIDIVYNKGASTIIILDNSITGMTGHQQNPATGLTLRNEPTRKLDLEALVRAVGVDRVTVVDPFDDGATAAAIKAELDADEPSVIIARRPCALLKGVRYTGKCVITEDCRDCGACVRSGCPAISRRSGRPRIDPAQCVGCDYCRGLCKFGAIGRVE